MSTAALKHKLETASIATLKPHPRNYRDHPDDQIKHLQQSIKQFGVYRNVVVSSDNVILAGHGIVKAAQRLKLKQLPIIRVALKSTDSAAIKLLIGDNEIEHLAEQNDRLLADLLKGLSDTGDLLGTGYDKQMVASFLMVTRPESEIKTFDEAAEWLGMPEYQTGEKRDSFVVVSFERPTHRAAFAAKLGIDLSAGAKTMWWPMRDREDVRSVRFVQGNGKRK